MKLNGTPQFLVGVDDVLILLQNENVKKSKKIQTLLEVSRDVGLEINSEQTKHLWLSVTRMEDVIVI